jgi:hypothetical protein
MKGEAAITALGDHLDEVAARNDLAPGQLRKLLREDKSAHVAPQGQVFFVEAAAPEPTPTAAAATYTPTVSTSQTFLLHSRPAATRKIYLDFNGITMPRNAWGIATNTTYGGFDTSGASAFSTSEHGFVQEVWRQVSESYAPFDVDVTTQDPGKDGLSRTTSDDTRYGAHVVITSSSAARTALCGGCLGVAWLGTYDRLENSTTALYYQPAWVFAYSTGFDPMVIAQGVTHEVGHTLGLEHDATSTTDYYPGTAAWGPVMGSARPRAVTQFSVGEYTGADNKQDDFAVIRSEGLPMRADDHGDTTGAASQLGSWRSYDAGGVIGTRTDQDVFALSVDCATDLSVAASGIGPQTALDLSLRVLDESGNEVATASPPSGYTWPTGGVPTSNGMDAQVTVPGAAAGTYYAIVDGVGNGSPASGGWSDYGSVGQYRLTATGCAEATLPPVEEPPAPVLTRPTAPRIGTASSGALGGIVTAVARWSAPANFGGAPITKYRVAAQRLDSRNRVVRNYFSSYTKPTARLLSIRLPRGRYVFKVMAWNKVGASPWSKASRIVTAR